MRAFSTALVLCVLTLPLAAQTIPDPGVGLAVSFSGVQTDVQVPFTLGNKAMLIPGLSLVHVEKAGTDVGLGAALRMYLRREEVSPYAAFRAAYFSLAPEKGRAESDLLAGVAFGAEYFLRPRLSLGIEAQLNATFSGERSARFNAPDRTTVNTGATATLIVYL